MIRLLTTLAFIVTLSGCAITIPIGGEHHLHVSAAEEVWQGLNTVDFATTVSLARQPCKYQETGTPTEDIIGRHPTEGHVYEYWAVESTLHLLASSWIDREVDATDSTGWKVFQKIWQVASIGESTYYVQRNWRNGLRPFQGGADCHTNAIRTERGPPPRRP